MAPEVVLMNELLPYTLPRKKMLQGKVESGALTLSGLRERARKLQEKNAAEKKAKAEKGMIKDRKKKLSNMELLTQAAKNASSGASRKEVIREEREKQLKSSSATSSKKLKL